MDTPNPIRKAHPDAEAGERDTRRTVIPSPRRDGGMFPGWGVRV
jgi:hypothetical protein